MQNLSDPMYALKEIIRVGKLDSQIAISVLKKSFKTSKFKNIIQKSDLERKLFSRCCLTEKLAKIFDQYVL